MNNNKKSHKILFIIGGVILGFIILGVIIFVVISLNSKKLTCTSVEGDITIMYNDKTLTGYTAKDISYDLDGQSAYAESVGVEKYLSEFTQWFENNTSGTCTK